MESTIAVAVFFLKPKNGRFEINKIIGKHLLRRRFFSDIFVFCIYFFFNSIQDLGKFIAVVIVIKKVISLSTFVVLCKIVHA